MFSDPAYIGAVAFFRVSPCSLALRVFLLNGPRGDNEVSTYECTGVYVPVALSSSLLSNYLLPPFWEYMYRMFSTFHLQLWCKLTFVQESTPYMATVE